MALSRRAAVRGLLGAAQSLAVGAVALARGATQRPGLVLAVVEGPDEALDLQADLRAFRAAEEADASAGGRRVANPEGSNEDVWADQTRPATASLPDELKRGARLETLLFPAWDVLPTESDRPEGLTLAGRRLVQERLRLLRDAAEPPPEALVLIAPVVALLQPVEAPEAVGDYLVLQPGETQDPILLGRRLVDMGFERTAQVEVRGEFALRGGILDIFPYTSDLPYRIDFFGDTIESISPFDPISQRSQAAVERIRLADSSPQRLRKLFSPGASGGPFTLLDHLPAHAAVAWLGPERLGRRAELYSASLVSGRSLGLDLNELRARAEAHFSSLDLHPPAGAEESDAAPDAGEPDAPAEIRCTSMQRLQGEPSVHADAWKKLAASRLAVYVFCETGGDRQRLETLLKEAGVLPAPSVRLVLGRLSGGFDLRAASLAALSDREILGRSKHAAAPSARRKAAAGTRPLSSIFELTLGDFVVHASHGIARYLGLARLEKSGRTEDYLTLQFADTVKLYVPAPHIGLVSKYIGGESEPELSKLGGKSWARKKARAEAAIKDIAEDLLSVQAARRGLPGIVYPPDTEWQHTFEDAFPYEPTTDQAAAIEAVKRDMMATCPMDRLLCGDVGFGKTEVAVRAAFKAVSAGKQVAVLVPTTLLCEQHGRTFAERFAGYPVSVATLSRFKSKRQQKELLQRLASGRLDVVIGTHRLLQKDVSFKDLGLAIVDEEQRFGVEHKEFFKQLRKSVDVLTLTATPIPRTLHMALLGLRDISNLMTPPRNRLSVTTKVARVSDDLVRRAVLRELSRGGQVFVVHPRVYDIDEFAARLAKLLPEARFAVGHGQMDGDELEDTMRRFLHHEIDVLVSTTIVESGLDIASANTMLIHEADRFGLAELHQLRGRVGRSDLQAYCYLLLPESSPVTPEGLRRLRALEEFDELGAGFQIALKDLELRGAGNVLGAEQSGQIAEVGYDLYCKLLDGTVRRLKGEPPPPQELEVNVILRGASFLPETYVQDEKAVLEFYRRLDGCHSNAEIDALKAEVIERFGPLAEAAERLFEEAKLRRLAQAAHVPYVGFDREEQRLILKLHDWDLKLADRALRGLPEVKGVRVIDGQTFSFGLTLKAKTNEAALRELARNLLEPLATFRARHGATESRTSGRPAASVPSI
ncbi:MAG: transcription-repair-coupling factor [Planctomycetota bacterium]